MTDKIMNDCLMNGNFIKINRKILKWEWWSDINTFRLFMYMLIAAWWKPGSYKGKSISRGSFPSSISELSRETKLTENEIRTALKHLKSTGEITSKSHSKFTVFTVKNYDLYQSDNEQNCKQITGENAVKPHSINEQITSKSQAINEQLTSTIINNINNIDTEKEDKKERKEENRIVSKDTICQTQSVRRIVNKWNELATCGVKGIDRVSSSSKRYKSLVARLNEYGEEKVIEAIENIKASDFLKGKNWTGWVITFDWFVKPNNFPKVLENNYDNRNGLNARGYQNRTAEMLHDGYDMIAEWVQEKEMEENGNDA